MSVFVVIAMILGILLAGLVEHLQAFHCSL